MEDWRKGFHKAMVDTIFQEGSPLKIDPATRFYGWQAWNFGEIRDHVTRVGIDYEATSEPLESEWLEFKGTFYEGDPTTYGVDLTLILNDGTAYPWRSTMRMAEFIVAVIRRDEPEPAPGVRRRG